MLHSVQTTTDTITAEVCAYRKERFQLSDKVCHI